MANCCGSRRCGSGTQDATLNGYFQQMSDLMRDEAGLISRATPRVRLWFADLKDANLAGAYLMGAYLRSSKLICADLRGPFRRDPDLFCVDLTNANHRGTVLWDADLTGPSRRTRKQLEHASTHENPSRPE